MSEREEARTESIRKLAAVLVGVLATMEDTGLCRPGDALPALLLAAGTTAAFLGCDADEIGGLAADAVTLCRDGRARMRDSAAGRLS